jgi:hypothetical protein
MDNRDVVHYNVIKQRIQIMLTEQKPTARQKATKYWNQSLQTRGRHFNGLDKLVDNPALWLAANSDLIVNATMGPKKNILSVFWNDKDSLVIVTPDLEALEVDKKKLIKPLLLDMDYLNTVVRIAVYRREDDLPTELDENALCIILSGQFIQIQTNGMITRKHSVWYKKTGSTA